MDPQNQNPNQNIPTNIPTQMPVQNKSSLGSILGTIIIIGIIILGGLYFWGKRIEESKLNQNLVSQSTDETPQVQDEASVIKSVSSGDDFQSIQADLDNTNTSNLDKEVNQ